MVNEASRNAEVIAAWTSSNSASICAINARRFAPPTKEVYPTKRLTAWFLLLALVVACAPALAASNAKPRPILVTAYRQVGWGDRVQIGCVDEDGRCWFVDGHDEALN